MSGTFYSDEDIYPRSPGLEAVYPKPTPSPSPPPVVTKVYHPPVSSPSSRRRKKANRRKTRPTQGDWVLIREMDPNRPDIAQQVSQEALNSDTGSDEDEMEDQSPDTATSPLVSNTTQLPRSFTQPFSLQQTTRDEIRKEDLQTATSTHRDSVLDADIRANAFITERRGSEAVPVTILPNGASTNMDDARYPTPIISSSMPSTMSPTVQQQRSGSVANVWPTEESATHLRQLQIPQVRDKLPAFQPQSPPRDAASPNTQQLPSIQHMVGDLARSPSISEEAHRTSSFAHRQSVSSVGQSPTSIVRQLSLNSNSPASPFPPFSASSPVSAASELQKGDLFLRSGGHVFGADHRRPSQASENGRYPPTLHSNSTSDGYQSSDGPSPVTQQTPVERHMSIDGTLASSTTIILPPPNGSGIQHVPSQVVGTFRCDHPGCTAAPFQTQYLLNSHTNVHSQSRPHYCPVEGCPRAEGGKGFKRKNEMIRHGLVHQSPGYVCPFCPDREHKYPRPDNLQRHVRVHHVDKDKDDPDLRDVLAQRPEGGSRGRRRRVSGV